jgi:hypothetical protein
MKRMAYGYRDIGCSRMTVHAAFPGESATNLFASGKAGKSLRVFGAMAGRFRE